MNLRYQRPAAKPKEGMRRTLLASCFIFILALFIHFHDTKEGITHFHLEPTAFIGSALLSFGLTFLGAVYLRANHRGIYDRFHKLALLATLCMISFVLAKGVEFAADHQVNFLTRNMHYPLLIPFVSILICLLLGSEVALFTSFFLNLIIGIALDVYLVPFLLMNFVTSIVAILCAKNMHKPKEIFAICGKIWLSALVVILAFHGMENTLGISVLLKDAYASFIFMLVSAVLVIALLPLMETFFHVMTDMTLLEFADPNSALLRRLILEAPGTYQHSLVVGNLAETAARAISANGLFCRISTLYHDIGKLFNPHYFNENQFGGLNIHQLLTPKESASVIIAHIGEGEELARKHRLPKSFIDIIKEHHGTSLVKYFFDRHRELLGEEHSQHDHHEFRYLGPKPRSKESAIIMIADKVEAASRSLREITPESITQMVDALVLERMHDGQFDDCQLTFEELAIVKKEMIKTLICARHLRIK